MASLLLFAIAVVEFVVVAVESGEAVPTAAEALDLALLDARSWVACSVCWEQDEMEC